jgi:hypothetical protein
LFRRIQESHAPRYLKPELKAAVHGAGVAVHEFAAEQRKLDWASEGQVEVDEFLDAVITDAERFLTAQRVATWALLAYDFGITRPPEALKGLVAKTEGAIGIENDQERWLAGFGPIPDPSEATDEDRNAKFIFGSCDGMIEATLAREIDRERLASAALEWTFWFGLGADTQQRFKKAVTEGN